MAYREHRFLARLLPLYASQGEVMSALLLLSQLTRSRYRDQNIQETKLSEICAVYIHVDGVIEDGAGLVKWFG